MFPEKFPGLSRKRAQGLDVGQGYLINHFNYLEGMGRVGCKLSELILERCCCLELKIKHLTMFHNPFVDCIRSYCNEAIDELDRWKIFCSAHSRMVSSWSLFCHLVYVLFINTDRAKSGDLAVSFCQSFVQIFAIFSEFYYPIKKQYEHSRVFRNCRSFMVCAIWLLTNFNKGASTKSSLLHDF